MTFPTIRHPTNGQQKLFPICFMREESNYSRDHNKILAKLITDKLNEAITDANQDATRRVSRIRVQYVNIPGRENNPDGCVGTWRALVEREVNQ